MPLRASFLWEADHVQAVADGGGEAELLGFQTLCIACHADKTREELQRRAAERREERHRKVMKMREEKVRHRAALQHEEAQHRGAVRREKKRQHVAVWQEEVRCCEPTQQEGTLQHKEA